MLNKVESRREFLINFLYFAVIVGIYCITVKYAFGYIFPFLFAAALAVFLQKPINKLKKALHIKAHGPISFALVLLIVILIVSLIVAICGITFYELREFFSFLFGQFSSLKEMFATIEKFSLDVVAKFPEAIRDSASTMVTKFFANLDGSGKPDGSFDFSVISGPLSGAWSILKSVPSAILAFLVTIISCFFMTADYEEIRDLILKMIPEKKRAHVISAKHTVTYGVGKMLKAYATIMLITFGEMFLGLYLMKIIGVYTGGYIAIISLVTCVVDIVPVLGTGTVVIPWALYNIFFGSPKLGIGLFVLYAVITVIRQIIEPKLVANQAGLPAIVTVMAMFIGAKLLGALGIIILPFTVIILKFMYDEGIFGGKKSEDAVTLTVEAPNECADCESGVSGQTEGEHVD